MNSPKGQRWLQDRLRSVAFDVLAQIAAADLQPSGPPVCGSARDRLYRVRITVAPADALTGQGEHFPGLHFSPFEVAVYHCLRAASGGPLSGKQIAARCSTDYDTKLKYLLQNLEERKVITLVEGKGYFLATPERSPGQPG
jgi:hypothetical protein